MSSDTAIKIDSVTKSFASRRAIDGLSLSVGIGESVFLCGANGAGKSTLLAIIAALIRPDRGNVEINGLNIRQNMEKAKQTLGFISHRPMLYADLTVEENLLFFADLYSVKQKKSRVDELLTQADISAYRHDRTGGLSRGMMQRLSIARALIHKPDILLADEAFTGLDKKSRNRLTDVFRNFKDKGQTLLMTTHDVLIGFACCDRVAVIDKGRKKFDAKVADIDAEEFSKDYLDWTGARQ